VSIKSYLIEKLFGAVIDRKVQERLPAAGSGDGDEHGWRRISGNSDRELPIAAWARQVEVCYWLWKTNPMGNWIVETLTNFVAGNGFTYTAENEEVKALLDAFWFDPVNRMDLKLEDKVRELSIFGVQCWPVFKAEQTGRVRLGMVDPSLIAAIFTDPHNAELQIGIQLYSPTAGHTRYLKTILVGEAETVMSEAAMQLREGYADGECFLFSVNRVSNDPYGTSDIFVIADWLDEYEEFIYNFSGKARKQNAYIWDVKLEGADETACAEYARKFPSQTDGAVRVHNEKVVWEAVAPNLQAIEIKESASVFRNHILGNKSIPEHWYGGGGDVNRNTATESNDPIQAFIRTRQNRVKFIIESVFTYVIQSAMDAGFLRVPAEEAFNFAVNVPEATNKDLTKIASAVQSIVTAMVAAAAQNWLDRDTAVKLFAFVIALTGFEIDPENILETEPGYEDYQKPGSRNGDKPGSRNGDRGTRKE